VRVDGRPVEVVAGGRRLLDVLHEDLGILAAKTGCESGECGACTVLVDGRAVCSCLVLAGQVADAEITTAQGLARDGLDPVQEAFIEEHATQCGFCTPGMVVAAAALLGVNPHPTEAEIRLALAGNLCRCTGYTAVVEAVSRAAGERSRGREPAEEGVGRR
jgi:carbon-monoxide dehydrogenase small subunit